MNRLPQAIEPPVARTEDGRVRRVGVEVELTGLEVTEIADAVCEVFGGTSQPETDYLIRIDSPVGEFRVEADLELLQEIGKRRAAETETGALSAARDVVARIAETIAPYEVVGPPLPYTDLPRIDELVAVLRERGGRGTKSGVLQALGMQLNPEAPRTSAASIHAHLRAYALLLPWLVERRGIDISRRATVFVDPYPRDYVRLLVGQDETPTLEQLIDDYLRHNPTRNRSLDMLPLFAHLDPDRVFAVVDDPRVKSRPTYHYRLPDSRVGDPSWRVVDDWRLWLVVERVAARPAVLRDLVASFNYEDDNATLWLTDADWAAKCEEILAANDYAAGAP